MQFQRVVMLMRNVGGLACRNLQLVVSSSECACATSTGTPATTLAQQLQGGWGCRAWQLQSSCSLCAPAPTYWSSLDAAQTPCCFDTLPCLLPPLLCCRPPQHHLPHLLA